MAEALTKSQAEIDDVMFEAAEDQRRFDQIYGNALAETRRALVHEVAIVTTAGIVLGGLVGAIAGMRRR